MLFNLFKKYSFIVLFRTCLDGDNFEKNYITKEILGVTDSQFTANRIAFDFANALGEVLNEKRGGYTRHTDLENGIITLKSNLTNGTSINEIISIERYAKE